MLDDGEGCKQQMAWKRLTGRAGQVATNDYASSCGQITAANVLHKDSA